MIDVLPGRAGAVPVDVRPLRAGDVVEAESMAWEALAGAGRRYGFEMGGRDDARVDFAQARLHHLLSTDPEGSLVADRDGEIVGLALGIRRGSLWFLSLLTVREGWQGAGIGRRLLDGALAHAAGCSAGMICASPDPKALRRYGRAGFALHAGVEAIGEPDRDLIPGGLGVRDGDWDRDRDLLEELIALRRGEPYGTDLDWCRTQGMRLLVRDGGPPGNRAATLLNGGRICVLAAASEDAATRLLWAAIAESTGHVRVPYLHNRQQWAISVALEAGLPLTVSDALATRGDLLIPPSPYLPSGMFG
jgi:predicted N-acetyltransferase YhbS